MAKVRLDRRTAYIIALFLMSGAALLYSISYSIGSLDNPGPGMWPTIGSAVMVIGTAVLLFPHRDSIDEYDPFTKNVRFVVYGLAVAMGWLLLTQNIGLIIGTFLFFYIWLTFISREKQVLTLIVSVIAAFSIYILFDVLLRAPFPAGFLERLIGL